MAEPFLDNLGMDAFSELESGVRVTRIVEPDASEASPGRYLGEGVAEGVRQRRRAVWLREYQGRCQPERRLASPGSPLGVHGEP